MNKTSCLKCIICNQKLGLSTNRTQKFAFYKKFMAHASKKTEIRSNFYSTVNE